MPQIVKLNLPHAPEGMLYLEDGGRRVLRVFPNFCSENTQALANLKAELDKLVGGLHRYDECIIYPKGHPRHPEGDES